MDGEIACCDYCRVFLQRVVRFTKESAWISLKDFNRSIKIVIVKILFESFCVS